MTKTWEDAIVGEIRAVREAHAKKFNYDLDAIFNDFKDYEKTLKDQRMERCKKKQLERLSSVANSCREENSPPKI